MAKSTPMSEVRASSPGVQEQEAAVQSMMGDLLGAAEVETLEDDSIRFVLPGRDAVTGKHNIQVILRDMTGGDLLAMEQMPSGDIDRTMRSISRLCVKWGSLEGISYEQIKKVRAKHITIAGQVFATFLK